MKSRWLDLFLLVAVLSGGVLAWRSGAERERLSARYDRLAKVASDLAVVDPSKVHILAMETGEPLHYAWRVYYPPNFQQILVGSDGGSGSSWSSGASEFIARVRLRRDDSGRLQIYRSFSGGSMRSGLGGPELSALLRQAGDRVEVEQLGAGGPAVLDPKQKAVLLRLSIPESLRAEALKKLPPHEQKQFAPVFFELTLGRDPADASSALIP